MPGGPFDSVRRPRGADHPHGGGLACADAGDIAVVVGGTIPQADVPKLLEVGAAAVFPTGTPLDVPVSRRYEH